jgi:ABC-type Fe3+ transport system permease subunit
MIRKIKTYIEQEPWDEALIRQDRLLRLAIWCILAIAALVFGPPCISIFMR